MPRTGGHKRKQVFAEINITPLTDIFLVLLTIMIVVAPFVRQMPPDIHLPEITAGAQVDRDRITVDVTTDGKYFVNSVEVTGDDLPTVLRDKAASQPVKRLVVQADRDTKSGAVLRVFRAAEEAQYDQMTVLGQATNRVEAKPRDDEGSPAGTL
jgi:biopolymer transport protein ExbD